MNEDGERRHKASSAGVSPAVVGASCSRILVALNPRRRVSTTNAGLKIGATGTGVTQAEDDRQEGAAETPVPKIRANDSQLR